MRSRMPRRGAAVMLGLVVALAFPLAASAATGGGGGGTGSATVGLTGGRLIGKVVAQLQVNVVCDPLLTLDPDTFEETTTTSGMIQFSSVSLLQAQGRVVASGNGEFYGSLTCDGSTVNHVAVDIATTNYPWKTGSAVGSATIFISDPMGYSGDFGNSGSVLLKLTSK